MLYLYRNKEINALIYNELICNTELIEDYPPN